MGRIFYLFLPFSTSFYLFSTCQGRKIQAHLSDILTKELIKKEILPFLPFFVISIITLWVSFCEIS